MGLFGHKGFFSKAGNAAKRGLKEVSHIGHHISNVIEAPIHAVNHMMGYDPDEPQKNGDSWYAGYNSNSGPIFIEGTQADQIMANDGISGSIGSDLEHPSGAGTIKEIENMNNMAAITTGGYKYNNIGKNPNTYTGNTAKTANSIKQGGMTKDDLIAYNQKHPNETAGTSGSMKTSLNSNTATARY